MTDNENNKECEIDNSKSKIDYKSFSSSYISFFFGAGVNGKCFPQLKNGFSHTKQKLKELLGEECTNIEKQINKIKNDADKVSISNIFKKEVIEQTNEIDKKCDSYKNIKNMFKNISQFAMSCENRTDAMKQINVFTLNYDEIIEDAINSNGDICFSIKPDSFNYNRSKMNIVGYNYRKHRAVPTYLVHHLHGTVENPVIPSDDKYGKIVDENFEIAFNMKEMLARECSILLIMGYSGNDAHFNKILKECWDLGLTIYWFKYTQDNNPPETLKGSVIVIDQYDYDNPIDETEILCREFNKWGSM